LADLPKAVHEATVTVEAAGAIQSPYEVRLRLAIGPRYSVRADGGGDFRTIQEAIDASVPGALIVVDPGTYPENIHFDGKWIVLRGTDPQDPEVVAATIIDGMNDGTVVSFDGTEGPETLLSGLTVTNGNERAGAGIRGATALRVPTRARVSYCRIIGNSGTAIREVDGEISHCLIRDNTSIASPGTLSTVSQCDGVIRDCVISDNLASEGAVGYSFGRLEDCLFENNRSYGDGGALFEYLGRVSNCEFRGNVARSPGTSRRSGGAIAGGAGRLEDCVFVGNESTDRGGAIAGWRGVIADCTIRANDSRLGGGISTSNADLVRCTVIDNHASESGGGLFTNEGDALLIACTVSSNSADVMGGGLLVASPDRPTLINCLFVRNTAVAGGAIALVDYSTPIQSHLNVRNCTLTGNSATRGGAISADSNSLPDLIEIADSLIWNGAGSIVIRNGSSIAIRYSDIQAGWIGEGNIDADPRFVDPDNDDFHLLSISPCIGVGDAGTFGIDEFDLDREPRVMGGRVDMGADEFTDRPFVFGDMNCDGRRDAFDIDPFLVALFNPNDYSRQFPKCDIRNGDLNVDGSIDAFDIEPFLDLLFP
jgi:predicted outer membrane repeat protein